MDTTNEPYGPVQTSAEQAERIEIKKVWRELASGNATNVEMLLSWIARTKPSGMLPEELAPKIDQKGEELLRKYCRKELPFGKPGIVYLLTLYFQSWADALNRMKCEEIGQFIDQFRKLVIDGVSDEEDTKSFP